MSDLKTRETVFENKYAHEQEMLFRAEARASKLLGLWAAQEMGMSADEAEHYAQAVVLSNLKQTGVGDVVSKVRDDLLGKGLKVDSVDTLMKQFMKDMKKQVEDEG